MISMLNAVSGISVCIPARNESATIQTTIQSVTEKYCGPPLEIIVCANACTDNTSDIVLSLSKNDSRIKLIHSEPGKPNAWNALMQESRNNDVVFLDGDVFVAPNSVENIVSFMHKHDYVAASAKNYKVAKNKLQEFINQPLEVPTIDSICGRMYSIQKDKLLVEMTAKGFSKMPADIINEDLWVALVLEKRLGRKVFEKKWGYCDAATAYFHIPNTLDDYKQMKRIHEGRLQMEHEYSGLGYVVDVDESISGKLSKWYQKWKEIKNPLMKLITPAVFITKKIIYSRLSYFARSSGRKSYMLRQHTNVWDEPLSTKKSFSEEIIRDVILYSKS